MISKAEIEKLRGKKIVVIGDLMLDEYIIGDIHRVSPEAPVPVILEKERKYRLGGAANVAINIHAMESTPIVVGVIGKDENGAIIKSLFEKFHIKSHLHEDDVKPTTVKTRFIAQRQQVLRRDIESTEPLTNDTNISLLERLKKVLQEERPDGVILQDYNKGIFTSDNITEIIEVIRSYDIPIFVDPKKDNFLMYKNVEVFKPNKKELYEAPLEANDLNGKVKELKEKLDAALIVCTLGEEGVLLYNNAVHKEQTHPIEVMDVSGAGDSSLSAITLGYLSGLNISAIGQLSNLAGGIACRKSEVSSVSLNEMIEYIGKK